MNDSYAKPTLDTDPRAEEDRDPEAPELTDIDHPDPEPATDIVPPSPPDQPERREGVVSDPDIVPQTKPV